MAIVPYQNRLKKLASELRKNMTPWEKKLWYEFLREQSPRFLRQKPLGSYIVDFYCPTLRLAIDYGTEGMERDAIRTAELGSLGITVLRFSDADIKENLSGVCSSITNLIQEKMKEGTP